MVQFETLRPPLGTDEVVLNISSSVFDEHRAHVNDHLNRLGAAHFIELANETDTDPFSGSQYTIVGPKGFSTEELILMPGTFGNGIWPHIVARAEAVSEMSKLAGLQDDVKQPLPILVVASPGMKSNFGLSEGELAEVTRGSFEPIAKRHLRIVHELGFGAVRGLYYSQAAALAAPITRLAERNFDIRSNVIGEYPLSRLGFLKEARRFKAERQKDNIEVIEELFATGNADQDMMAGVWHARKENMAIARGFGRLSLADDLRVHPSLIRIDTLLHASHSKVTPAKAAKEAYDYSRSGRKLTIPAGRLMRVEVNSNHTFGDRVGSFASVAAANLARASER